LPGSLPLLRVGDLREHRKRSDQRVFVLRLQDALSLIKEWDWIIRHRESLQNYFEKSRDRVNEMKRMARAGGCG
jgi:hypothetical protein